ncbi:RCC1 protein [Venustampulla echinocandica]|uniref:RCC1 protein n=1 Tax=Venustampulla echinocandica TaxID=2656787 RepID=A0A370TDS5_9HELO|nr:RCC1 protein [Venustampulla echinocandica]RDL32604.1 RCC1 protein [Venustampulla echinocandica]
MPLSAQATAKVMARKSTRRDAPPRAAKPAKPAKPTSIVAKVKAKAPAGTPAAKNPTSVPLLVPPVVLAAPKPSMKRPRPEEPAPQPSKRLKPDQSISSPPSQKLDVFVFGDGESGELGLGPKAIDGNPPVNVERPRLNRLLDAGAVGVVQVAVGGMHCISLTHDQNIYTWGVNDNGALGRDTTWEAPTRDIDGNSDTEEEDSDLSPKESTPIAVPTDECFGKHAKTYVQVAATDSASFALANDGSVYGWGSFRGNDGVMGFTTADAIDAAKTKMDKKKLQPRPILIPHLKKIKFLATGSDHVLALDHKGDVYAWGSGEQNQLGRRIVQRTRFQALTPCRFGLSKISSVSCGAYHNFAINAKGQVFAWGLNNYGQTGIADGAGEGDACVMKPTLVEALKPYRIKAISGENHHSIACTEDNEVLIWGRCDDSQAGIKLDTLPKDDVMLDSRGRPQILMKPTIIPGLRAVSVTAGIDNSIAITQEGKAYSWGFSDNFRTGLGTQEAVEAPTFLDNADVKGKRLTFAGCGGQFSVLAGPALLEGDY